MDEEQEMKYAIGVVIDRDLFPDKLFAPAKRTDLMPDGTNPVLDKELRSEIFSQGTLMLRVVIQVSMLLSIPLMGFWLFVWPDYAGYYVSYVLTFNLLVGPVFSSGSITQERERQTLNLLLTTLLRPGKIVFAKLMASLRVSTVLTFLLTEQLLLAYALIPELRERWWTLPVFLLIIATTCLATSTIGLLCSSLSRKTSVSMILTYLTLLILFIGPVGLRWYLQGFAGGISEERLSALTITSPFSATFSIPMTPSGGQMPVRVDGDNPMRMRTIPGLGLPVWGRLSTRLSAGLRRALPRDGDRLPIPLVARRRDLVAEGSRDRARVEIPHLVRSANDADGQGVVGDRSIRAVGVSKDDAEGAARFDVGLAGGLLGLEVVDLDHERVEHAGLFGLSLPFDNEPVPVTPEPGERAVARRRLAVVGQQEPHPLVMRARGARRRRHSRVLPARASSVRDVRV